MGPEHTALALAENSQWGMLYKMIMSHPQCAEECDDFAMMPLHWACTARDVQPRVVRKLVDAYPVAVMLKNKGGLIPLHIAIKAKAPIEVLQILVVKNDESVCEETPSGETAAELAQMYGLSREAISFLKDMEDDMRNSGRAPPRPSRFRPMSSTTIGVEARSNETERRGDVNVVRAHGVGGRNMQHNLPPRWKLDKKCNICQLKFSYFKSRHHCRNCGLSVCSTHSNRRLPLYHFGLDTPQRVCIMCYDDLREHGKPPSAVVNMYSSQNRVKKTQSDLHTQMAADRKPFGDLSNATPQRASLVHSQSIGSTYLSSIVSEDDDQRDSSGSARPRAHTEMDSTDRVEAMKDQVRELEAHVRELQQHKDRMNVAIAESNRMLQEAVKDKHLQERLVAQLRGSSTMDVRRVAPDDDAKASDKISSTEDEDDADTEDGDEALDETTLNIAATCYYLGLALFEKGDYTSAIVELRKSVDLNSRDADVWYTLARALHCAEESYDAEMAVRRALDIHPKNYSAMSLLGKILHSRGEHDKSIDVFQQALGLMSTGSDSDEEEDVGSMTVGW
ncbi:hypothetical protein Poli38472_005561 [Pythium oligandrum]|uniref:FYVE-type domain-containing protein n=1 Tax=Pythium oligandrum TaxID=41045 RepID=A0A8K1CH77_PYTOL|nr:hypothetical protein Poli38472_005561 [Pythium oligandrum]|eukprot:TMW62943.1 hypothetical protein Poli38472_005561 [Pythium oligandrum]